MAAKKFLDPVLLNIELIKLPLNKILDLEKETREFLEANDFETDIAISMEAWNPETLRSLYLQAPMLLIQRSTGYYCLGSGRAFRLAQEIFGPTEQVPALLIKSGRIKTETKLQLLAADLFGFSAINRTRRLVPRQLQSLCKSMHEAGISTIAGSGSKAFSHATGFSLKALTPDSPPKMTKTAEAGSVDDAECLAIPEDSLGDPE